MRIPFLLPLPVLLLVAASCAPGVHAPAGDPPTAESAGPPGTEAPSAENAALRHREIHWVRSAAEYRALTEQVYRHASEAVRRQHEAADRAVGSWAVIMDADETVLDNSEYQRRIAEAGLEFDEATWAEWVREEAATVVPGADDFIRVVQELGGRVAIVTNRDAPLCPATRRNMEALGLRTAVVLCRTDTSSKERRFRMVREGTAAGELPALEVVMWVGDNVGDFPGLDQGLRDAPDAAFEPFGERYFVLPNPMYGSWTGNDWR